MRSSPDGGNEARDPLPRDACLAALALTGCFDFDALRQPLDGGAASTDDLAGVVNLIWRTSSTSPMRTAAS